MALQVAFFFICTGLTGILSISTVSHVQVEVGSTVHIPCQYEDKYTGHVKYLCRGSVWRSCSYEIKTNQGNSAKYAIKDDKNQRIVTFTFKNVKLEASGYYWCNVEITGTDDGEQFQLSVTNKGESKLHVDSQWITGYFGEQVTIYFNNRGSGLPQWCRVGGPCISRSGQIDGTLVSIDSSVSGRIAVTMTSLWMMNIGWYWCSVGGLQMPVFLGVTVRPTTTTIATTTTLSTLSTATTELSAPPFSSNEPGKKSVSYIIAPVIALGLLILIAVLSLVVWFMLKRNMKKTEEELFSPEQLAVDPVYSNVSERPKSQDPCDDKEILYSSVSFTNNQAAIKIKDKEEDVVYSTLAHN